jgi:hypothetical protein
MKIIISLVLLFAFAFARAETSLTEEFSKLKQDEIQNSGIRPVERELKKITGVSIEVKPDWDSFKKSSYHAADELGADVQMLPQVFHKLMTDAEIGPKVKAKA